MTSTPQDLQLINDSILPCILGNKPFHPRTGPGVHMAYQEAAMFQAVCSSLQPHCAIEVGTETGGTLAIIARHSARVFSIDLDPAVKTKLQPKFSNVEFITGDSHAALPEVLRRLAAEGVTPDFIFIDGDHTADGVRKDIEHVLSFRPTSRMVVLMHDSFNPECRQGILSAQWRRNPFCHFVDVDFSPGSLHPDEAIQRQMWGGLGFALFLPEIRTHELQVKATHQISFEAALYQSVYRNQIQRR